MNENEKIELNIHEKTNSVVNNSGDVKNPYVPLVIIETPSWPFQWNHIDDVLTYNSKLFLMFVDFLSKFAQAL